MTQQTTEERQMEIQEEQEDALASLMSKVDMSSPLEIPLDNGQIFSISQEQFISYWLPRDATREEKAKCFNETRAAGLNPAIKGDCYYFRTGGGPLSLFVGYHVYLRKAYANGLNHIHKPELVYDEQTGELFSCIITFEIEGRPDFVWETWLSDVIGETNGKVNKRWVKAERQMLIKCSLTNTGRCSGIATLGILPPAVEEMPDFPAPGFRTMTQERLDDYEAQEEQEKTSIGAVSAENHQVDMRDFRISYFMALEKRNILQDEKDRQDMQEEKTGKRHTGDWGPAEYSIMQDYIHTIPIPDPEPEAAEAEGEQEDPQAHGQEAHDEWMEEQMAKAKAMGVPKAVTDIIEGNGKKDPQETEGEKPEDAEKTFYRAFPDRFKSIEELDIWLKRLVTEKPRSKWTAKDFQIALPLLMEVPLLSTKTQEGEEEAQDGAKESTQQTDSDKPDDVFLITKKTKLEIGALVLQIKDSPYGKSIRTQKFKRRAIEITGADYEDINNLLESDGQEIIEALTLEVAKENGEIVDPDPLNQGGEFGPDLVEMYIIKRTACFPSFGAWNKWERENKLPSGSIAKWDPEDVKRGIALLEGVTPLADIPDDNPEKMTQEQFDRIDAAVKKLPYNNVGSLKFRERVAEILKIPYQAIRSLDVKQGSDLVHEFEDEVQDFENKRGRHAPAVV